MRLSFMFFLASIITSSFCFSQEVDSNQTGPKSNIGMEKAYIVQLTEFRIKKSSDVKLSPSEILKSFDESKDQENFFVIETIQLSALAGYESMMQIGKRATVTVGTINNPGRGPSRQTQQQSIGTLVRLTAEPSNGKTLLKLSYEASRLEGEGSDDRQPDTKTFQVNTTLLLETAKTALVGGTSAESTTYLAVTVK